MVDYGNYFGRGGKEVENVVGTWYGENCMASSKIVGNLFFFSFFFNG